MKLINIKKNEYKPVLILFIQFFAVVASSITGSSARDAFFLNLFDKNYLPLMFIVIAVTMVIVINIYKRITHGKDIIHVITVGGIIFSIALLVIQFSLTRLFSMSVAGESIDLLPEKWLIPFLYVFMEIIIALSILQFWMLAGEVFDSRQAKRLYGFLGAGGSIAGISVGYSLKPFVSLFGSNKLLLLTVFFIGLYVLMGLLIKDHRDVNGRKKQKVKERNIEKKSKFKYNSYLKSIALLVGLAAFISKIIDYQFKMTAVHTFPIQDELVTFFGTYYMATGAATLIMQFFITGMVLARFGILVGLLFLPISLALGSSGFLMLPILATIFIAKFSDQVFKFSINNISQEILWLPVPRDKKILAKPVLTSTVKAAAEGAVGILIFVLVYVNLIPTNKLYLLSVIALAGIIFWMWNCFRLKKGYLKTLKLAIEKRQLNLEDVEFDMAATHIVQTIEKTLKDKDEFKQLFGIDLLKSFPLEPWKKMLVDLFQNGTPNVKLAILELAGNKAEIIEDNHVIEASKHGDDIKSEAIVITGDRNLTEISDELYQNLTRGDLKIRVASACALIKMKIHLDESKKLLHALLNSQDVNELKVSLHFLDKPIGVLSVEKIIDLLQHESYEVREASLRIAEARHDPILVDHIIKTLAHPKTAMRSRNVLSSYDEKFVLNKFAKNLFDPETEKHLKIGIIRALKYYGSEKAIEMLIKVLDHLRWYGLYDHPPFLEMTMEATNSLLFIARRDSLSDDFIKMVGSNLRAIAKRAYQLALFDDSLPDDEHCFLIKSQIESDITTIISIMLKLSILHDPKTNIEIYTQYIAKNDPELMPFVLELVDTSFSTENRKLMIPLIDNDFDKVQNAKEMFDYLLIEFDEIILSWVHGLDKWKESIALYYVIKSKRKDLLKKIEWNIIQDTILVNQIISRIKAETGKIHEIIPVKYYNLKKETDMYSILEKTILLKSVDLFKNIPVEIIKTIAQISEEIYYSEETLIFSEGDHGSSMYVVVDGKVKIHKGTLHIATVEKSAVLGEMALLDHAPRSADATAQTETTVLKVSHESFHDLMVENVEILQQIVKLLSERLRNTTTQLGI